MKKNPNRLSYDQPMEGYKRFSNYVKIKLWEDFRAVCAEENKSYTQGIEEALENWVYVEVANDD